MWVKKFISETQTPHPEITDIFNNIREPSTSVFDKTTFFKSKNFERYDPLMNSGAMRSAPSRKNHQKRALLIGPLILHKRATLL